jgi:HK97 family phage prohead protease
MNHEVSPYGLEFKYAPLTRPPGEAESAINGYASVFGVADQGGDVVEPGAFGASLKRLSNAGCSVKMLWQHDPTSPVGVWDCVGEDALGLSVKGRLLTEIAQGAEAAALLAFGAIDGLSIGYRTLRSEKMRGGGRRLIELDLWEVSLVTFPMLPTARASATAPEQVISLAETLTAALSGARRAFA